MSTSPSNGGVALGIDVGGTWIRAAIVDDQGCILASRRCATPRDCDSDDLVCLLVDQAGGLCDSVSMSPIDLRAIGLALPALFEARCGTVRRSVNLPHLEGTAPAATLANELGVSAYTITDADAAGLGECYARYGTVSRRFVHLRFGTGIACSLIDDCRPVAIEPDRTRHLALLVVDDADNAKQCPCGLRGCLETIASGKALISRTISAGIGDELPTLQSAFLVGNPDAIRIVAVAASAIVLALKRIGEQLRPDALSLGGGVLDHVPALWQQVTEKGIVVGLFERARLGDDAGVVGAARHAQRCVGPGA